VSKFVPLDLIIDLILFLWNIIFMFYCTRVRPQCDFSILGREGGQSARWRFFPLPVSDLSLVDAARAILDTLWTQREG